MVLVTDLTIQFLLSKEKCRIELGVAFALGKLKAENSGDKYTSMKYCLS